MAMDKNLLDVRLRNSKDVFLRAYENLIELDLFKPFKSYHENCLERSGFTKKAIKDSIGRDTNPILDKNGYHYSLFRSSNFKPPESIPEVSSYFLEVENFVRSNISEEHSHVKWSSGIFKFSSFESLSIPISEKNNFKLSRKLSLYNCIGWSCFIRDLMEMFYPEYNFVTKNDIGQYRFLKSIGENLFLGFEYDNNDFISECTLGYLDLPEIRMIVCEGDNVEECCVSNNNLLHLSLFNHPLALALPSFKSYISIGLIKNNDGKIEIINPIKEVSDNSVVRLSGDEELGSSYKKYLYCFVSYTALLNNCYLNYYEDLLSEGNS